MSRLDALAGVKGKNDKMYWTKIGSAWPAEKGVGYTLYLDYLPIARDEKGKCMIILREPSEKQEGAPQRAARPAPAAMDDDIPF